MNLQFPSPLEKLPLSDDLDVYIKRDDMIHPLISGNKFRKLKGYLDQKKCSKVITFGGPFSNHIHATAAYCFANDIECELIIRGKDSDPMNPTLQDLQKWNARLHFVSRTEYRKLKYGDQIERKAGTVVIPEGGWGKAGFKGLEDLVEELNDQQGDYNEIILPVGSATTLIGIALYVQHPIRVTGIRAVRDDSLYEKVKPYSVKSKADIQLIEGYEWGGFAKYDSQLISFMEDMKKEYKLPLDFVYNAKAFYAMMDLIRNDYFSKDSTIIYLHTGGLQGNRGLSYRKTGNNQ